MKITTEKVLVEIPLSDSTFFKQLADKMEWQVIKRQDIWDKYINQCPDKTELSNDNILQKW
jgi:hypothetical protein